MKARRQSAILDIIQRAPVKSQEQLRKSMRARGYDVTQATLSRDIRDLGLVKAGGAYQAPSQLVSNGQPSKSALQRALGEQLLGVQRVQQLVLLRTGLGHANSVCAVLDQARLPEVVGTLAGEDTILVVTPDARRARALVRRIEQTAGGNAGKALRDTLR